MKYAKVQLLLFQNAVLKSLHDKNGHFGFEKTYALVRNRFFLTYNEVCSESLL